MRRRLKKEKLDVPYAFTGIILDNGTLSQDAQIQARGCGAVHKKRELHLKVCVRLGCTGTGPVRSPCARPAINTNPTQPLTPPPELTEIQHHHHHHHHHHQGLLYSSNHSFLFFFAFFCGWPRPPPLLKISNIFFSPFTTTRCSADLHTVCLDPSYGLLTKTIPFKDPAPPLFSPLIFP
ncbi:hypothetical protein B9Z19DRAFT_330123 [Tuber borchii]|uniref:Uncharacterized protein n=1 Tax=Tuber borchii TaxID=42251 RepID=A0A2T6ZJG2_TUBBO|nr:hypothetical protein B9Z19DRAFT_330123 [Tuber borchii]